MYTFARKQYCQEFIGANEDSSKQVDSHYGSPVEQLRQSATYINCRTRKQISRLSVFDARTLRFEPCVVTTSLISPLGAIAYLHPSSTSTITTPMAAAVPKTFWGSPIRYLRWASHEKPAIFWSCVIGALGPVALVGIPPLRRMVGDEDPPKIPMTYPGE